MKYQKPLTIIAGVMLILAIPSIWPYGYYQLLRLVVCGVAILNAYLFNKDGNTGWAVVMGLVALLFNPIAPVYLEKETWVWLDLVTACLMFISISKVKTAITYSK
jgi:hypothetical protein